MQHRVLVRPLRLQLPQHGACALDGGARVLLFANLAAYNMYNRVEHHSSLLYYSTQCTNYKLSVHMQSNECRRCKCRRSKIHYMASSSYVYCVVSEYCGWFYFLSGESDNMIGHRVLKISKHIVNFCNSHTPSHVCSCEVKCNMYKPEAVVSLPVFGPCDSVALPLVETQCWARTLSPVPHPDNSKTIFQSMLKSEYFNVSY